MAKIETIPLDEGLTRAFACPLGCRVETDFDLLRLRSQLSVWGQDYRAVGCRLVLSIDSGAFARDSGTRDAVLKLARSADLDLHRLEGSL